MGHTTWMEERTVRVRHRETQPGPELAGLDRDALEHIRALGDDLLRSITSDFRHGAPDDIASIKQGLWAADPEAVGRAAHRLKGNCLILGATGMGTVAAAIEREASDGRLDRVEQQVPALERSYGDLIPTLDSLL